jgi:hypothetical protein
MSASIGDHFGEFRLWVERLPLRERLPFAYGFSDLRYNPDKGVIGIVSGVGTAPAASIIAATPPASCSLHACGCRRLYRGNVCALAIIGK